MGALGFPVQRSAVGGISAVGVVKLLHVNAVLPTSHARRGGLRPWRAGPAGYQPRGGKGWAGPGLGLEWAGPASLRACDRLALGGRGLAAFSGGRTGSAAFLISLAAKRARADPAPAAEPSWARPAPGPAPHEYRSRARWVGRNRG